MNFYLYKIEHPGWIWIKLWSWLLRRRTWHEFICFILRRSFRLVAVYIPKMILFRCVSRSEVNTSRTHTFSLIILKRSSNIYAHTKLGWIVYVFGSNLSKHWFLGDGLYMQIGRTGTHYYCWPVGQGQLHQDTGRDQRRSRPGKQQVRWRGPHQDNAGHLQASKHAFITLQFPGYAS
jgi:hypothetical protein